MSCLHSLAENQTAPGRLRSGAFSLIELLVVVAIIAILAALLLPALSASKSRAKSINCLSNLHQMGIAAQMYVDDHAGYFPVAYYQTEENDVITYYAWDLTTISGATNRVVPGILWQGQGAEKVQQCPAFTGSANWNTDPYSGYNYNTSYLGHGQNESIPEPARSSAVRQPMQTLIFGDGEYADGANKFMRAPWPNPGDVAFSGRYSGTQGFRHNDRSNAVFCDGHAQSLKDRFTANADGPDKVAPHTGFLSPDNSWYDLE
ncbi:MAG TPA: prepilin-type N-terminal cleavage/methylation domain-containing protein [Dongiaceae bacterium]|nr:prepilin-type N-terminal cleavage/methylation domain-containing protein [Dongiaceae bacterium]